MAITAADVVPGAKLRWLTQPGGVPVCIGEIFTITRVAGDRAAYVYPSGKETSRPVENIALHAEMVDGPILAEAPPLPPAPAPPEACSAGCNPAAPCLAHAGCPGHLPEYTGNDGFSAWLYKEDWRGTASVHDAVLPPFGTAPQLTAPEGRPMYILGRFVVDPPPVGPEPMRNGSGALACDWIERSRR